MATLFPELAMRVRRLAEPWRVELKVEKVSDCGGEVSRWVEWEEDEV
jgi:hypothetical protein